MKRVFGCSLLIAFLVVPGLPAAAATVAEIDVGPVTLLETGKVRVVLRVECARGYALVSQQANVSWSQQTPAGQLFSTPVSFFTDVLCDGVTHTVVRRLARRSSSGDRFDPTVPLNVTASMQLQNRAGATANAEAVESVVLG